MSIMTALPLAGVGRSADVLSHEATFTADMYAKARIAQHSTAPMAGNFARQLGAQTLVLTHFSGRFTEFRGKVRSWSYLYVKDRPEYLVSLHVDWHKPLCSWRRTTVAGMLDLSIVKFPDSTLKGALGTLMLGRVRRMRCPETFMR